MKCASVFSNLACALLKSVSAFLLYTCLVGSTSTRFQRLAFTFRDQRCEATLGEEDCFFVASCSALQLHMTTMRRPVHAENDFRRAVEVIGVLQDEEVRAKLGDLKPAAITYDMHFDVC